MPAHDKVHAATGVVLSLGDFGAVLVGVGAVLGLGALAQAGGGTWGGTLARPQLRLTTGLEGAGAVLIAVGSLVLAFASQDTLGILIAALVVLAVAEGVVYVFMAIHLRRHLALIHQTAPENPARSFWWCLAHPL